MHGAVSAAMNISNYTTDFLGSEISDHTYAQECAWRRRMHAHNSQAFDIEKILSPPSELGKSSAKKRKRVVKKTKSVKKRRKSKANP